MAHHTCFIIISYPLTCVVSLPCNALLFSWHHYWNYYNISSFLYFSVSQFSPLTLPLELFLFQCFSRRSGAHLDSNYLSFLKTRTLKNWGNEGYRLIGNNLYMGTILGIWPHYPPYTVIHKPMANKFSHLHGDLNMWRNMLLVCYMYMQPD